MRMGQPGRWGMLLVPVTRPVSMAAEPARAALEQLIGGPDPGAGLKPVLPASVRVEGLTLEGNTAAVDFNPELAGLMIRRGCGSRCAVPHRIARH